MDRIQIPSYIFFVYGIASYLLGRYLNNGNTAKIKNLLVKYSFFIAISILLLGVFIFKDENVKQASFIFSSVYFGFWLAEEQRKRNEVRTLKYYLGLIWEELRFNTHQIKVIESNYKFLFDTPQEISLNASKMGTVYSLSGLLKTGSHNAFISSQAVTTLTSEYIKPIERADNLFNTIEIAYSNIEHLKSFLHTTTIDFRNKASIEAEILRSPFKVGAIDDMKAKVKSTAEQLMIAKRTILKAKNLVNKHLDELGVKTDTEELRLSVLTQKDKKFIKQVIRTKPVSPDEVFQKTE